MKLTKIITEEYETLSEQKIAKEHAPSTIYQTLLGAYQLWLEECTLIEEKNAEEEWGNYAEDIRVSEKYKAASENATHFISECTHTDIFQLSKEIVRFEEHFEFSESGLFLSAIINEHYKRYTDSPYLIHTKKYVHAMNYLGFELDGAEIHIIGDAGHNLGYLMSSGTIIVNGDTRMGIGSFMENGKIVVCGNAEDAIGFKMKGGEILIQKNAGMRVGYGLEGGTITLYGNCGSELGQISGGEVYIEGSIDMSKGPIEESDREKTKIFHKGKQIFPKKE